MEMMGGREKVYESQLLTRLFLRTGEIESKEQIFGGGRRELRKEEADNLKVPVCRRATAPLIRITTTHRHYADTENGQGCY